MDQRHTTYSRPLDRHLIQNPNHQAISQPPSQPHAGLYHAPPSQQPSFQIPPSDPFQRRAPDPFLPNPQAQRRGSYGLSSSHDVVSVSHAEQRPSLGAAWTSTSGSTPGVASIHHQPGPPPPPTISSAHRETTAAGYPYDTSRRRSIGGQSPPRYYAAAPSNETPPPPAPFSNRQMPPPSPSQQPPPGPAYPSQQRGPLPPPPFTSGRELPGLGSMPRPGAGMSISSILGDAPSTQPPSYPHHSPPMGHSGSPVGGSMQPPSPHRRGHSMTSKMEYQWRRPQTPEKHHIPVGLRASEAVYSASTSPAHYATVGRSPEFARNGPAPYQNQYQPIGGLRAFQGSPIDGHDREQQRHVDDRMPPRPDSQPTGLAAPAPSEGSKDAIPAFGTRPPFTAYQPHERRDDHRTSITSAYSGDHTPSSRDRPTTVEPQGHSAYSPPNSQRDMMGREKPREEQVKEYSRRDDYTAPFRTGFRNQYYQPLSAVPAPEAPRSHPQMIDPFRRPQEGQPIFTAHERQFQPIDPRDDRRTSEPQTTGAELHYRNLMQDHQPLAMQRSRSSLGIEGKRGRASPLPQAVQGAQMQPTGVGSDPSIKSEFGRIFQGLGSGLGHGSLTPSRGSPMPHRHAADAEPIVLSDAEAPRSGGGRSSKKHRRVKEEESRPDGEGVDGRGTPGARGSKRTKAGHHHHLHQHLPHHHHVHGHAHKPEDDPVRNPFSGPHVQSAPAVHHHHHIHTSHHHHHTPLAPRTQVQTPIVPLPKPTLTVNSQAVVDSVKDRPRKHLGSELYEPKIALPPAALSSHADDKFGYFLQYQPSRSFDEKDINCTFTIRVPRNYLSQEARENICRNRNLFGSEVYTDDSDPIAVLIHSGWLRGEWPEDADTELMDLPPAPLELVGVPDGEEITTRPGIPFLPPPDRDLQITMVILPQLRNYRGCVRYGVKSRDWDEGEAHDGLSWMVGKCRWVDESGGKGERRSGKARRERLEMLRSEAAAALVGLGAVSGVGGGGGKRGLERFNGRTGIVA